METVSKKEKKYLVQYLDQPETYEVMAYTVGDAAMRWSNEHSEFDADTLTITAPDGNQWVVTVEEVTSRRVTSMLFVPSDPPGVAS